LAFHSHSAGAAGFALREQSVEVQGASFAGVGAGTNGLSSMIWNRATMSLHNDQGLITQNNTSIILPYSMAKNGTGFPGSPDSGDIGQTGIIPASCSVYRLMDDLTIGMAIGVPWPVRSMAMSSRPCRST
jgi:long-chain fatty acid transport protein